MKTLFVAAAILAGALIASDARADGCQGGPFCNRGHLGLFGGAFAHQPVPAFQAAPWYLYWPYNAHFMTPAPLTGAYYAPPHGGGGHMVNPYFPAANYPGHPAPGYPAPGYPAPGGSYPVPGAPAPLPATVVPGGPNSNR
jgi:hypothetical protein